MGMDTALVATAAAAASSRPETPCTEPKVKIYILCSGATDKEAEDSVRACTDAVHTLLGA